MFLVRVGPLVRGVATRGEFGASRAMIEACPRFEIVSIYRVGYDAIGLVACRARNLTAHLAGRPLPTAVL